MFNKTSSKSTKCFFMFSLKKSCFSHATTTRILLFYILICRKWKSFFFYSPLPVYIIFYLLCTFAYFSICTTAKNWFDTMCPLELLSKNHLSDIITYSQTTRVRNYSQIFKKKTRKKKNMKKQKKYYPYIIFALV